jgi:hypothetical protein
VGAGVTYRAFTLVVPYYDNPEMFREQQRVWRAFKADVRGALHVVVVDDGSPRYPAKASVDPATAPSLASFRLFRTKVDVRWNWIFCRNLGVQQAKTDWVLLTDIDHVVPAPTWLRLMRGRLDPMCAYRLSRVLADGTPHPPHPNTWIMTRHLFLNRVGGYDERYSGVYGSDGQFHKRVTAWTRCVHVLPDVAKLYGPEQIADAWTSAYERKTAEDRARKDEIKQAIVAMGNDYTPRRLTFPWEQVI